MKNKLLKCMGLMLTILVMSLNAVYAEDDMEVAKSEIMNYMNQVIESSKDETIADFTSVKEYYIDKMICTDSSDMMLTEYNKNRRFEDILTGINKYYIPYISNSGENCCMIFQERDNEIVYVRSEYAIKQPYDFTINDELYPELKGQTIEDIIYTDNENYYVILAYVKTDSNEYIIPFFSDVVNESLNLESGKMMLCEDYFYLMNRYYDESKLPNYDLSKPEKIMFGGQPFLRDEPLDTFSYNTGKNEKEYKWIAAGVSGAVIIALVCTGVLKGSKRKKV